MRFCFHLYHSPATGPQQAPSPMVALCVTWEKQQPPWTLSTVLRAHGSGQAWPLWMAGQTEGTARLSSGHLQSGCVEGVILTETAQQRWRVSWVPLAAPSSRREGAVGPRQALGCKAGEGAGPEVPGAGSETKRLQAPGSSCFLMGFMTFETSGSVQLPLTTADHSH